MTAPETARPSASTGLDDLLDDLREVVGVIGCGYPVVPPLPRAAADDAVAAPAAPVDLSVLAAALDGYEDYGS